MPDNNAASKLDTLLEEWDKKPDADNKEVLARLNKLEEENKGLREDADARNKVTKESEEAAAYKEDIAPIIKTLKADVNASDDRAEEWINTEGRTNKKLAKAWDDRSENPEVLDKIIEKLIPKFKESVEKEARSILNMKDDDLTPEQKKAKEEKENKKAELDNQEDKDARAMASAMRIVRGDNKPIGDDYENTEWSGLTGHEFAVKSEQVFADMRSGKLKPIKK